MSEIVRYQHASRPVKLWRCRHLLGVPYRALKIWLYAMRHEAKDPDAWPMSFKASWGLALGLAQCKMHHYWHWTELEEEFKGYFDVDADSDH